jgi:hypothetical protein
MNFESLNLALVRDEFNADMFDENLDNEQHIEEMMNRQAARAMKKTCNLHLTQLPMYRLAQVVKAMRQNMPPSAIALCDVPTSSHIEWRSYYTDEELRALKLKHINLQEYPNHKDIKHIGLVV